MWTLVAYTEDVKVVGVRSDVAVATAITTIIKLLVIMYMYSILSFIGT